MAYYAKDFIDPLTGKSAYALMRENLDLARGFIDTFDREFSNLFLYGNTGLGKPEPLKYEFRDYWSRRITEEHRLVYRIEDNGQQITVISCRKHYE